MTNRDQRVPQSPADLQEYRRAKMLQKLERQKESMEIGYTGEIVQVGGELPVCSVVQNIRFRALLTEYGTERLELARV